MQGHYTCYEAAELFGVNFRTVYNWTRSGKLRAVKIGKRWYIPKEAVSALLEHGEEQHKKTARRGGAKGGETSGGAYI